MALCSYKVLTIKNKMVPTYIQEKWRDLKKNNHKMQLLDQENDIYIYTIWKQKVTKRSRTILTASCLVIFPISFSSFKNVWNLKFHQIIMKMQTKGVKVHIHFQMLHELVSLINMETSFNINITSTEILVIIHIISFNDKYLAYHMDSVTCILKNHIKNSTFLFS